MTDSSSALSSADAPAETGEIHMGELLTRISQECRSLAEVADQLHGFARLVAEQNQDVEVITSLQALDRMQQYLSAFARIFGDCARSSGEDWVLNLKPTLETLTLSDLARRLAGQQESACEPADLDLF